MAAAVTGLGLLAALTACADDAPRVGFGGQPEPPATVSPAPTASTPWEVVPPGAVPLPDTQLDLVALPEGHPRTVWTTDAGRVVGMYGQEGGCGRVHPELRAQDAEEVRITLVEVVKSAGPCTMDLRFPPVTVHLADPLADRLVTIDREVIGPPAR